MVPVNDRRSMAGTAVGGVLVLLGVSLLLRTSGIVPGIVLDVIDRAAGPLALIVVGIVVLLVSKKAPATGPLTRSRADRWLAGVFGGLGPYIGVDPLVLRIAAIVLAVVGQGWIVAAYIIAWVLVPEEPAPYAPPSA